VPSNGFKFIFIAAHPINSEVAYIKLLTNLGI